MKKRLLVLLYSLVTFSTVVLPLGATDPQTLTFGKSYDADSCDELVEVLPPPVFQWVKKGDMIMDVEKLSFDPKFSDIFIEASNKNAGKFGIRDDGYLVDNQTQKHPEYFYGLPFPGQIEPDDPKAANKIMENYQYATARLGAVSSVATLKCINKRGLEREMTSLSNRLYYQGRPGGPLKNPNRYLKQSLICILTPFDLRGTVSMTWFYSSDEPDTLPMPIISGVSGAYPRPCVRPLFRELICAWMI